MTTIKTYWDDDVDGIIIGEVTFPYQFWISETRPEYQDKRGVPLRKICERSFSTDEQAIEWFKANYPDEFKRGVEMRCFDV